MRTQKSLWRLNAGGSFRNFRVIRVIIYIIILSLLLFPASSCQDPRRGRRPCKAQNQGGNTMQYYVPLVSIFVSILHSKSANGK